MESSLVEAAAMAPLTVEVPAILVFDVDLNQALAWENTILVHDRFKVRYVSNFID